MEDYPTSAAPYTRKQEDLSRSRRAESVGRFNPRRAHCTRSNEESERERESGKR